MSGVEPLLDSLVAFLPSPADRPDSIAVNTKTGDKKTISCTSNDLCALAFKVVYDAARGPLVYVRTYSGTLSAKQVLYNTTQNNKERINQLLLVSADDLTNMASIGPGSVACIVGLRNTKTGDTLVADKGPLQTYVLDGLSIPEAVFSLAVEPEKSSQQAELELALNILCMEDPSLLVEIDKESGQTILKGLGELHLEIVSDKLYRQFNIKVTTGRAYVNYRESISSVEGNILSQKHTYDRTIGFKRMFASLVIDIHPFGVEEDCSGLEKDKNKKASDEPIIEITPAVRQQCTADEYIALLEGLRASFIRGPKGFPVTGFRLIVQSIEKDSDTTPGAIRACTASFVDHLLRSNRRILLEPMMSVVIEVPYSRLGDVLSDITVKRRGEVIEVITNEVINLNTIVASIPLATLLGYATAIRSLTQGEGSFSMEYLGHNEVMESIADDFIKYGT